MIFKHQVSTVFETVNWVYAKTFHTLYEDENNFLTQQIWLTFGELEGSLAICAVSKNIE